MSAIRQPAVAGHFYPADAAEITDWLATLPVSEPLEFYPPRMLLVPHAGYAYSGALAALAIQQIPRGRYSRVIILAPGHRVAAQRVLLPAEQCIAFATPLGEVPLDREVVDYQETFQCLKS